jgi:hypothetical protein
MYYVDSSQFSGFDAPLLREVQELYSHYPRKDTLEQMCSRTPSFCALHAL